jgi:uncharacterized protein YciI
MSAFVVIREAGPAWAEGGIATQPALSDHGAFMRALTAEHVVLVAGPLAGTEQGRIRAMLIVNADDEADIHRRLADDPWTISGQLRTATVETWNLFEGAERLSLSGDATSTAAARA